MIPVHRDVIADLVTPLGAFLRLDSDPTAPAYLLESVEGGEKWGRYSIIGLQPSAEIRTRGSRVEERRAGRWRARTVPDPLGEICQRAEECEVSGAEGLPRFWGGLVGYLGYDMVRCIERLPEHAERDLPVWDSYLIEASLVVVLDSLRQRALVIAPVRIEGPAVDDPGGAYDAAVARIDAAVTRLHSAGAGAATQTAEGDLTAADPHSNLDGAAFGRLVDRAREYIVAGDVIQVVLSRRFEVEAAGVRPFDLYRALRLANPSPYLFFLRFPEYAVVGASPELLVRREAQTVEVRPIAGTRRRGATAEEDSAIEAELLADPKEIAEHVMLLDLGRNDVGRIAEIGSVAVTERMEVERYSTVMHLVSSVRGRVAAGLPMVDVVRATFPAGTLTGAPKVRAMEIIEELEPHGRNVYGGAAGYLGYDGNVDLAIAIRSVLALGDRLYVQVGAGIVHDSTPAREFEETREKAGGVLRAIRLAREAFRS